MHVYVCIVSIDFTFTNNKNKLEKQKKTEVEITIDENSDDITPKEKFSFLLPFPSYDNNGEQICDRRIWLSELHVDFGLFSKILQSYNGSYFLISYNLLTKWLLSFGQQ